MPRRTSSFFPILLFSAVNAGLMLALCLFWLSLPRTFGDEAFLIKWTSLVKKTALGIDKKPAAEDFLYVDVSRSKALVPAIDPLFEDYTGYNYVAVTDRIRLADFLAAINTYGEDVQIVIMDVAFTDGAEGDSLLQSVIDARTFPLAGAISLEMARDTSPPIIDLPTGIAMYLSVDENFMKYPLFFDTVPTLPLLALHESNGVGYSRTDWSTRVGGKRSLSNPIIDFKVRPFDLREKRYFIHDLGSLLFQFTFWEEADIRKILSGKTIVIGDFASDVHNTIFGSVPGPIIVHNAYLTLLAGETLIPWEWIVLLLALFFFMSWRVYRQERDDEPGWISTKRLTAVGRIIVDSIDDTLLLILGTVVSYFLFNIHINILILLIYLKIVTYGLRKLVLHRSVAATEIEDGDA